MHDAGWELAIRKLIWIFVEEISICTPIPWTVLRVWKLYIRPGASRYNTGLSNGPLEPLEHHCTMVPRGLIGAPDGAVNPAESLPPLTRLITKVPVWKQFAPRQIFGVFPDWFGTKWNFIHKPKHLPPSLTEFSDIFTIFSFRNKNLSRFALSYNYGPNYK